jgi:coenzyme F420-reducing hydrogenase gamma subunit
MLDQGKRFLNWLKEIQIDEFRLIEDEPMTAEHYDICLVEGNPITKENIKLLKKMRKISDKLIVVGNCAALGGVWEAKNYKSKKNTVRQVYKKIKVENPDIKEVDNFVKVDFTIPGCPIDGDEFMRIANEISSGLVSRIDQSPVCYECQTKGYECLLLKGEICLGPITLGGCQAVCLKSKQSCWGCRGLFDGAQVENFMNHLFSKFSRDDVYRVMEVFGARDTILKEFSIQQGKDIKKPTSTKTPAGKKPAKKKTTKKKIKK